MGTEQAGGFYIPDLGQGLVIKRSKLVEGAKAEMMTRVKEEKKLLTTALHSYGSLICY